MKQFMLLAMMMTSLTVFSQTSPALKKNTSFVTALNEIVQEYYKNFESSKGEMINESVGVTSFESKVTLPGALSSIITKYTPPESYSWEARMDETDEYEVAAQKYNQYYRQLSSTKLSPGGFEKIRLIGYYDAPDEGRSFASSQLKLESTKDGRDNFFINLSMQYEFPIWSIIISMYEKVPDSEIRPGMRSLR